MIVKAPSLPPKVASVLARACSRIGSINKTQAVKFPYLVDVVSSGVLGRCVTEGTHQAWAMGVVTVEAYRRVESDRGFDCSPGGGYEGSVSIKRATDAPPPVELTVEEKAIVDFVVDTYGSLSAADLGELTKQLNPEISRSQWASSHVNPPAKVDEDAFARLSSDYRHYVARLAAMNVSDRSQWGTPIENDPRTHLRQMLGR